MNYGIKLTGYTIEGRSVQVEDDEEDLGAGEVEHGGISGHGRDPR